MLLFLGVVVAFRLTVLFAPIGLFARILLWFFVLRVFRILVFGWLLVAVLAEVCFLDFDWLREFWMVVVCFPFGLWL